MEAQGDSATSKFNSLHIKVSVAAFCPTIVIQSTCSEVVFHNRKHLRRSSKVLGLRGGQKLHYLLLQATLVIWENVHHSATEI